MNHDQIVSELVKLNEMEMTTVLETLKEHIEKSHFPNLAEYVFHSDRKEELQHENRELLIQVEELREEKRNQVQSIRTFLKDL